MCDFDGILRGSYFRGEPIGRAEVEVRVGKLKNGKTTGEMIKGGSDRMVDWIWRYVMWPLCCAGGLEICCPIVQG